MSNRGLRYNRIEDMPQGMQQLMHKAGKAAPARGPAEHQVRAPMEKRPKYGNVITTVDGIRFDSKRGGKDYRAVVEGWNEPGGTRVSLDIEGLPMAPEGSIYEFWFTRDDIHISAGTFVSPIDVQLWAGVTRREFPRLWITLEPIDNDESPSGINVMDTG